MILSRLQDIVLDLRFSKSALYLFNPFNTYLYLWTIKHHKKY